MMRIDITFRPDMTASFKPGSAGRASTMAPSGRVHPLATRKAG
ncbi:hypothetical protein P7L64_00340 (plasmid) [Tistrella bauzanensis]|nr:hypothetical protein [Tistrella bauzanensis]